MKSTLVRQVAAWGLLLPVVGLCALAQEDSPAAAPGAEEEVAPGQKAAKEAPSDAAVAIRNIALAHELAKYGQKNRSPAALMTAAEMLLDNRVQNSQERAPKRTEDEGEEDAGAPPTAGAEATALLDAAAKIAAEEDQTGFADRLTDLRKRAAEAPRGGHPAINVTGYLGSFDSQDYFHGHFDGHNEVYVHQMGGGYPCDFDLKVEDQYGNVVDSDTRPDSDAHLHWDGHGNYTIILTLHNAGPRRDYHLTSN